MITIEWILPGQFPTILHADFFNSLMAELLLLSLVTEELFFSSREGSVQSINSVMLSQTSQVLFRLRRTCTQNVYTNLQWNVFANLKLILLTSEGSLIARKSTASESCRFLWTVVKLTLLTFVPDPSCGAIGRAAVVAKNNIAAAKTTWIFLVIAISKNNYLLCWKLRI